VQFVINNLEACTDLLNKVRARIDKAAGLTAENRFGCGSYGNWVTHSQKARVSKL
jgi:hypothetical protein